MQLHITSQHTIADIQAEFHQYFPCLKLSFFSKKHDEFKSSHAKFIISDVHTPLRGLVALKEEGEFKFDTNISTWEFEKAIEDRFGLHVQVFRKSGSLWLETNVSDHLTLAAQNEKGERSDHFVPSEDEKPDYRERD